MKKYLILLLSFGFALSCFSQKTKKNELPLFGAELMKNIQGCENYRWCDLFFDLIPKNGGKAEKGKEKSASGTGQCFLAEVLSVFRPDSRAQALSEKVPVLSD
mgnify:CR=1 FL=1